MNDKELKELLKSSIYEAGRDIIKKCVSWFMVGFVINICVIAALGGFDKDDTDGESRSGMKLHSDNKTGCQYLSVKNGAISPRVDGRGNHIGCYSEVK